MLEHLNEKPAMPERVVVAGASGFLGSALCRRLAGEGAAHIALSSNEVDLAADGAAEKLAGMLREGDALVMLAALTPDRGRDVATLMRNLRMAEQVCAALAERPVAQVVYLSSDAVYSFRSETVSEETPAEPGDLYAAMHRTRELIFQDACKEMPLAVLRPTLLYGEGDTHGSYGPNWFRRQAAETGRISLGGEGEETRDHMFVADAAAVIAEVVRHRSRGLLNLASGRSESFRRVAELVAGAFPREIEIAGSPRQFPITHRRFDVSAMRQAFPDLAATPLEEGLEAAHAEVAEVG